MHRREFLEMNLKLLALGLVPASALLPACTKNRPSAGPSALASLGALMSANHSLAADGKHTQFFYYDLAKEKIDEIPMPLEFPHVAVGHPARRHLVLVPESGGRRACVVDLREKKVIKALEARPGRLFGGHGVFLRDGSRLFCSEFEPPPSGKGYVSEWDASTFRRISSFPSGGRFPHDVAIQPGGTHMTASNLGAEEGPHVKYGGTFVARINLETKKVEERFELNENEAEMNGVPLAGEGVSLAQNDAVMRTDARYFISYMQVANPHFKVFLYAHSHQPVVGIWDIPQKRLVREIRFPEQPRALVLTYPKTHIAVVLPSGRLRFIDVKRKELDDSLEAKLPLRVTTHMNNWWPWDSEPPKPAGGGAGGYS